MRKENVIKFVSGVFVLYIVISSLLGSSLEFSNLQFISYTNYILFFLSFIYAVCNLNKEYFKNNINHKIDKVILFFLVSFLVTIIINESKVNNIKILYFTILQMIVLFHFPLFNKKTTFNILKIYTLLIAFINIVSFFILLFNINYGINSERACGLYNGVNTGAICVGIAMILSVIFYKNESNKYFKTAYIINMILGMIMLGSFQSRASAVLLATFGCVFSFMLISINKGVIKSSIISILIALILVASPTITNRINKFMFAQFDNFRQSFVINADDQIEKQESERPGGRTESDTTGSNSARINLLKGGVMVALDNPLFGVGQQNVSINIIEKLGVEINGVYGGGTHNTYIQMFAANGLFGLMPYLCILIILLIKGYKYYIKHYKDKSIDENYYIYAGMISLMVALSVYGMFEITLVMISTICAYIYWLILGIVNTVE